MAKNGRIRGMKAPRLPNRKKCCGCGACRASCPKGAIAMLPDEEGFLQPVVDAAKCVGCGKCEAVCPVLHPGKSRKPLAVYAAKAKDDELRWGSASGGVFTVLAQDVLKRGGVVFGAGFERPTWRVIHKAATNEEELDDLRGSKYVQSDTGDTFKETKSYLDAGREVLYSGCPCQIAALKSFLGKDYPNLLTVDLICHGVPSPLAWRKYLDCREKEAGGKISRILARRYCAWQEFAISLEFDNSGKIAYCKNGTDDLFVRGFFSYWYLRPCCHSCLFRSSLRVSDVTIGDYMLIDRVKPGFSDEAGVSMYTINCDRAYVADTLLSSRCDRVVIDYVKAQRYNYPLVKNPKVSRLRLLFFKSLLGCDFDETFFLMQKMRSTTLLWHLLWWAKRFVVNHELNKVQWK